MHADTITLQVVNEQPVGTESAQLVRKVNEGANLAAETHGFESHYGWQSGNFDEHVHYIRTHTDRIVGDLTAATRGYSTLGIENWTSDASLGFETVGAPAPHLRFYFVEDPRKHSGTANIFATNPYLKALEQLISDSRAQPPPLETEHHSKMVDPFNIGSRLDEFRCLEDGWASGIQGAEGWGKISEGL